MYIHYIRKLSNSTCSHLMYSTSLPIIPVVFPPGHPTVDIAGPLFPALDTKRMLCFKQSSDINSNTALKMDKKCQWFGNYTIRITVLFFQAMYASLSYFQPLSLVLI